eukprot:UN02319
MKPNQSQSKVVIQGIGHFYKRGLSIEFHLDISFFIQKFLCHQTFWYLRFPNYHRVSYTSGYLVRRSVVPARILT